MKCLYCLGGRCAQCIGSAIRSELTEAGVITYPRRYCQCPCKAGA